jgi:tRNA nucleotidyltransferase/poly(A) polymerase
MSLKLLLTLLDDVATESGTSQPLIVGGLVRDRVLGNLQKSFNDIDITTGDKTVFNLAASYAMELRKQMPILVKNTRPRDHAPEDPGHISIYLKDFKIDFSSNFRTPNIVQILQIMGIENPTEMKQELYSRDFFCNTLLMSLDFKRVKDITGQGIKDLENKIIRTCLTPNLTFKYNTNRIIRVVYLAAKLGFDVDPKIIEWIKHNPEYIMQSEKSYLSKNINKALSLDADRAVYLINKMNMWKFIPITEALVPYYSKIMSKRIL